MRFFLIVALMAKAALLQAQSIDSTLKRYSDNFQQERVYFHFDRSAYFPGDTIWFKAYIMAGWSLSNISKSLYTDWTDANGNLILHGAAPIIMSSSYGQMVIPKNYKEDVFHLHSYTGWMLNFDSSFLFDKDITIIQPTGASKNKIPGHKVRVSLMPEGGNVVQSLMSTIAFKAENQSGRPVFITGAVKNKNGEVLDSISPDHDGMGKFSLSPDAGEVYTVSWKDDEGDSGITKLPPALSTGAILKASGSVGKVSFHIDRTTDAPANFRKMYLIATIHQSEAFKLTIDLEKTTGATNSIPTAQLPSGILQLTLFDANWKPVAERVVFVNNNEYSFATNITATKKNLNKRGRNEVVIDVPDTAASNLSVSVTDAGLVHDASYNIISHLLLTSDLKGYINNPAYYFSNQSDSVKQALDLVMLTNGWRRYNWDDIVMGTLPVVKYSKDTSFITVKGQVTMPGNKAINEGTLINLNMRSTNLDDSLHIAFTQPVNADGSFQVAPGAFYDSLEVYYKLLGARKTENRGEVTFSSNFVAPPANYHNLKILPTTEEDSLAIINSLALRAKSEELERLLKQTTLKNVTVTAKTKTKEQALDESYASSQFRGNFGGGYSFDVQNDPAAKGSYNITNYLTDKIPGLQQQVSSGLPPVTHYFYRPRMNMQGVMMGRVTVFVDELQTDDEFVQTIPLTEIAYVKFFNKGVLPAADDNPALLIYTRRDGGSATSSVKYTTVAGFTPVKEFYYPDYSNEATAPQGADVRATLYWNPFILTGAGTNKVKFAFYNNDVSKRLRVVLEGVNSDGKITRVERVLE